MDPYAISPVERSRHMDQFASLAPPGGMIAGVQAKNYFMQSGLPPMVLAQIWYDKRTRIVSVRDLNSYMIFFHDGQGLGGYERGWSNGSE